MLLLLPVPTRTPSGRSELIRHGDRITFPFIQMWTKKKKKKKKKSLIQDAVSNLLLHV